MSVDLPLQTVGYDPLVPAEAAAKFNVEFLELEELWPVVDFITVHTPLIPQTRGKWLGVLVVQYSGEFHSEFIALVKMCSCRLHVTLSCI